MTVASPCPYLPPSATASVPLSGEALPYQPLPIQDFVLIQDSTDMAPQEGAIYNFTEGEIPTVLKERAITVFPPLPGAIEEVSGIVMLEILENDSPGWHPFLVEGIKGDTISLLRLYPQMVSVAKYGSPVAHNSNQMGPVTEEIIYLIKAEIPVANVSHYFHIREGSPITKEALETLMCRLSGTPVSTIPTDSYSS